LGIQNLYNTTRAKVLTGLAAATLAGGITVANPAYGQPETSQPVSERVEQVRARYQIAIEAQGDSLEVAAQEKVMSYFSEEQLENAEQFVNELKLKLATTYFAHAQTIEDMTADVKAAIEAQDFSGLEENLELYKTTAMDFIDVVREGGLEFYQENQPWIDQTIEDAKRTFTDPEFVAKMQEYDADMEKTWGGKFSEIYEANRPLLDQILEDVKTRFQDPTFIAQVEAHQDSIQRFVVGTVMGKDFLAEYDTIEANIDSLETQMELEIREIEAQ